MSAPLEEELEEALPLRVPLPPKRITFLLPNHSVTRGAIGFGSILCLIARGEQDLDYPYSSSSSPSDALSQDAQMIGNDLRRLLSEKITMDEAKDEK